MFKKILIILSFLSFPGVGFTAGLDDFLITVKTDNPGTSLSDQFTIPTAASTGFIYSYNVDCDDDGTDEFTSQSGDVTCDYSSLGGAGTYTIRIEKASEIDTIGFHRIYFNNSGDKSKLISVDQWGTGLWSTMDDAFEGTNNLSITATDAPDLAEGASMVNAFASSGITNENLSAWDTGVVTSFLNTFSQTSYNGDITTWDTSSSTSFSAMFFFNTSFNQDIGGWDTSSADNMSGMFFGATAFNQDIGGWDTSSVINISSMFRSASLFNQDIGNWETGNVTNMSSMFNSAASFDQDISYKEGLGNQGGDAWDTSSVLNMSSMFISTPFNQDIGNWDTSGVTTMFGMFSSNTQFNQDIGSWQTPELQFAASMFFGATAFNQDIGDWDMADVGSVNNMFRLASSFNQDIGDWDTSSFTRTDFMFYDADSFDQDISGWNMEGVTNTNSMFGLTPGLSLENYDALLAGWDSQNLQSGLNFDAGGSNYCDSASERANMISSDSWTITDGGADCAPDAPDSAPDMLDSSDSGFYSNDDITNDTTPTFQIECSTVGYTLNLIADDGAATSSIATHVCVATGTVEVTASALADDTYDITYTDEATPKVAPNVSDASPALSVTIDTTTPGGKSGSGGDPDLIDASDTGTTTDNITEDTTPTFEVQCFQVGLVSILYVDGVENGSQICASTDPHNVTVETELDDGTYSITHALADIAGNTNLETAALSITIDTSEADDDGDGLFNQVEDDGPNGGDGDDDGTLDSAQAHVSTLVNDVTGEYFTLKASQGGTTCDTISAIDVLAESELAEQDGSFSYPVGLFDFDIDCSNPGDSVDITFYLDQVYDTTGWVQKKYDSTNDTYSEINATTTYATAVIGTTTVTTISYTLVDGGPDDEDGLANGVIVDPSGPALPPEDDDDDEDEPYRSSGNGRVYSCKDKNAINYRLYGVEDNRKCKYEEDDSSDQELIQDLLNQLRELEELLRLHQSRASQSCTPFTKYMKKGDTDTVLGIPEVTKLQNTLKKLGVYNGPVTGYFGPLTEQAVKNWQTQHKQEVLSPWGLTTASGWFYQSSLKKMNELVCQD